MPRMSSFLTPLNPSMKVPPKRKGNAGGANCRTFTHTLNESPSEKEGKWATVNKAECMAFYPSMKVPPKRKGNLAARSSVLSLVVPSMKVPPKRKGNLIGVASTLGLSISLNESPSEKEGKCRIFEQRE